VAERRSQRRGQILDAAWDIAAESGLAAVSLHEVARRIGIRQPSLYGYVTSKLDLYDAMFGQAYEQLLARLDAAPGGGTAREQLVRLSRLVLEFVVENPPRQQLLFQRTIPGFEPSPASYALAQRLVDRCAALLSALGAGSPAHVDVYTALIAGLGGQQVANDPGGDRWTRHLEALLDVFLDHFAPEEPA
jgi:AcrR family transcriptional regulator